METKPRQDANKDANKDANSLLAAPPRVVNVGLELFAVDLARSSPSPHSPSKTGVDALMVGEGRGGGSGGLVAPVPHGTTPTPDPSPAEPAYTRGSATSLSDRSRASPTSVGGGEQRTRVVHVQWSPVAGGNAHLAGLLGKLRS
jgi:hypothetical protein